MTMFSHVMLGGRDLDEAKKFYDATMGVLGYDAGVMDDKGRLFYMNERGIFAISIPINGEPASAGNGSTIGFNVESPEQGDAWHAAGVANGGMAIEDPPGIRKSDGNGMYLAYLRDPSGNKICVLKRM